MVVVDVVDVLRVIALVRISTCLCSGLVSSNCYVTCGDTRLTCLSEFVRLMHDHRRRTMRQVCILQGTFEPPR